MVVNIRQNGTQRTVWFVVAHRGSGFRIPALPKAEFDRLVWCGIIGSPLRRRGEDSAGDSIDRHISQHLGHLESWFAGERIRLEEG